MSKIEDSVCADIQARAALGIQKYGVTLERKDIDLEGWLHHAYEEALDLACYLRRAIAEQELLRTLKGIAERKNEVKAKAETESAQNVHSVDFPVGLNIRLRGTSTEGKVIGYTDRDAEGEINLLVRFSDGDTFISSRLVEII